MKKRRFAVLGLGQFGSSLADELTKRGCEVLAVDKDPERVELLRDKVALAAVADIRDRAALEELITSPFDVAILAVGDQLEPAILATLHLKDLMVEEVWAEATSPESAEVLKRVGADKIISPERDMGQRIARRLANPNLIEFLPLTSGYAVVEVEAPAWTHGKTLLELGLRREMQIAVIAIRSADGMPAIVPGGAAQVQPGDVLTLVGRDADIATFRKRK